MIKTSYLAKLKEIVHNEPDAVITIVSRGPLKPSAELLADFMNMKKLHEARGLSEFEARKRAWNLVDYERRYRRHIMNLPEALEQIRLIKELDRKGKTIYLICYEKEAPCHRFIVKDIVDKGEW